MSSEKMNTEGEMIPNYNIDTETRTGSQENEKISEQSFIVQDFNCFHYIINFIINLGIVILTVAEFIIRKKSSYLTSILENLVDIFILFVFFFVILYYFSKKENYLKGLIYYPICSLFWGFGDLLTIFCYGNPYDWNTADTFKALKITLIFISLLFNFTYMRFNNK